MDNRARFAALAEKFSGEPGGDVGHHGRLMKEWLAVRANAASHWPGLAREALHFVAGTK